MTDEMSFSVPDENYEEVKKAIRSYSSLRFNYNPHKESDGKYRISVSGTSEDLNAFNCCLVLMEKPKAEKKKGLLEKLAGVFGLD